MKKKSYTTDKSVSRLYPSTHYIKKIQFLSERPTLKGYLATFLEANNPVELATLIDTVSFKDVTLINAPSTIDRLLSVWEMMIEYADFISKFEPHTFSLIANPLKEFVFEEQLQEDKETADASKNESGALKNEVFSIFDALATQAEKIERGMAQAGYHNLPQNAVTHALATESAHFSEDLGFNLFFEFEEHLSQLDRALTGTEKKTNISRLTISQEHRQLIFDQWTHLIAAFEEIWVSAPPEIARLIGTSDSYLEAIKELGLQIAFWNRVGGALVISGCFPPPLDTQNPTLPDKEKTALNVGNGNNDPTNNDDFDLEKFFADECARRKIPDWLDKGVELLLLAKINLEIGDVSDDFKIKLIGVLRSSPVLFPAIREVILLQIAPTLLNRPDDEAIFEIEDGITLSALSHTNFPHAKNLDAPYSEALQEFDSLFNELGLAQRAVSDIVFFDIAERVLGHPYDDVANFGSLEMFWHEGQSRLNKIFKSGLRSPNLPQQANSIGALSECLGFTLDLANKNSSPNSIWLFAMLMKHDPENWPDKRAEKFLSCVSRLLDDGLITTAGYCFCFFVATQAILAGRSLKSIRDDNGINPICPLGSWEEITRIADKLSRSGWSNRIERSFALAIELIQICKSDLIDFATSQMHSFSGGYGLSSRSKGAIASIAELSEKERGTFSPPIRDRLSEAMGAKQWGSLSSGLQQRLVVLERNHDTNLGDESVFGGKTTGWAIDYFDIVEGILKQQLGGLWGPKFLTKSADAIKVATKGRLAMPNRFTVAASIYICKGAFEIRTPEILRFLTEKQIDIDALSGKFGSDILENLIRERNKLAHSEGLAEKEASARAIRDWILEKIHRFIEVLGVKSQYLKSN